MDKCESFLQTVHVMEILAEMCSCKRNGEKVSSTGKQQDSAETEETTATGKVKGNSSAKQIYKIALFRRACIRSRAHLNTLKSINTQSNLHVVTISFLSKEVVNDALYFTNVGLYNLQGLGGESVGVMANSTWNKHDASCQNQLCLPIYSVQIHSVLFSYIQCDVLLPKPHQQVLMKLVKNCVFNTQIFIKIFEEIPLALQLQNKMF